MLTSVDVPAPVDEELGSVDAVSPAPVDVDFESADVKVEPPLTDVESDLRMSHNCGPPRRASDTAASPQYLACRPRPPPSSGCRLRCTSRNRVRGCLPS